MLTRPAAPTNLAAAYVRQRAVLMQWVAPVPSAGLTGYQLEVATDAGFSQNLQTLTPAGGALSFDVITGISPQTTYYFRLRAKNTVDESGYGDYSNVVTVTTPPDPPVAPVFLAATGLTQTSMFINWTPVTGGPVSGYTLEFSRNANFSAPLDSIVINNGGAGQQQITGLTSKTIYYFRIRAFNAGGYSPYSTVQQVQTLPDPPSAPTAFTIGTVTQTTVALSWVAPATADQTGYELQYSTDPTFSGTTPSVSIAGNALTYTLTGLTPFTTYYLRLRATNAGGGSVPAEANFTTLPNPPAAPTALAVVNGTLTQTGFTLGWTAPTGPITGYDLDVSTSPTFASGVTTLNPAAGATSFPISGLTQNTTYYVRLRANNTGGTGAYSTPAFEVTTLPTPPAAPTALVASAITATGLTLSWTAPSGPISSYALEYSTDNTFASGVTTLTPAGGATSQAITGLSANTTYFFRLKAINLGGESPFSTPALSATTLPGPPSNLAASNVLQTTLTLTWNAPGGTLTGYALRYSTSPDPSGATPVSVDASATSFNVTGLTPNTTYYFQISALNGSGSSLASNVLQVSTLPNPPAAPTNLTATAITTTGLTLTWTPPAGPISSYVLQYSTDDTFTTIFTQLPPAGNATSAVITGLTANTTYFFRLKAINAGGESPFAATTGISTLPGAPTALTASAITQTTLTLSWTAPTGTVTGYELQRAIDAGFTVGLTSIPVTGTPTTVDVTGLTANTAYFFRLRALNASGASSYTAAQATTLPNPPAAPTNLSASAITQTSLTLSWTAPAGPITGYTLEYSTDNTFASGVTTLNPGGAATTQAITGLTANTTYFFRLKATNTGGTSAEATAQATTLPTVPGVPTGFTATAASSSQINLSWTSGGGQTAQELQYSTSSTFASNVQNVAVSGSATSASVTGLTQGTTYYFRLRGQNAGGFSGYANAQATTLTNPPAAPTNLSASAITQTSLTLSWTAPGGPITGYTLEYSTDNTFASGVTTLTPGGGATSQAITGLTANTTYHFRLRANNAGGPSPNATTQATTPPNLPGVPTGFAATAASSSQINLSWTSGGGQTAQELQYSTSSTFASNVQNVAVAGNATSASVTGLSEGTTYYFRLRGQNTAGFSGYANAQATTLTNPPNGPSNLSANAVSPTQINLTWTDNSGNESGFYIERATGAGSFTQIAQVNANATSYSSNGLGENTTYRFRVRAFNSAGASGYSNEASATTPFTLPAAPANLSASATGQTTINLTWSDNAGNETNYDVEQSTNGTTFTRIAQLGAGATSFGVTGLTANTTYSFRVRATNPAGASGYSNVAQARTLPNPPAAPNTLAASDIAQTTVRLTWRDNSDNETRFEIERSGDGNNFNNIGNAAVNTTQFAVTGLTLETKYFFRVRAVNDGGGSAYSNVVEVLTLPIAPRAPTNLRASDTTQTTIRLTWVDNATDDTGYEVLRADTTTGTLRKVADLPANSTSYVAATLLVDKLYRFAVRAVGPGGPSANSNEIQAQTLPFAPAAPTQVQAQAVNQTAILVRWRNPGGPVSQIRVEQSLDGRTFTPARTLPPSPQSANVENLQPNTIYFYRLQAVNRGGVSPYSTVVTDTTFGTPPAAPTVLRTDELQARQLRLRWQDNATSESHYEIEQFRNNRFERIGTILANIDSFRVTGLTDQTEYRFRVRARNRSGFSDYTNELRVTTPLGAPEAPLNLVVANDRGGPQITLKWSVPLKSITDSLEVERSLDGQPYQVIQRLPGALDSTIVSGLVLGERYLFRVRARNRSGYSAYSNVVERRSLPTGLEPQANSRVRIQPNPVDRDVLVETEDPNNRLRTVEVFNTVGQRVFRWEADGPERGRTLSLDGLPPGVYILSAETTHGVTRQKVLKR